MDKTRKNTNNAKRLAITSANTRTRQRYGRLGQTRVANLFKPSEGPHNIVALKQRNARREELAKLESIVDKSKEAGSSLRTLQKQLSDGLSAAKRSGSATVKIELSIVTATKLLRVLGFVIGLVLFVSYWGVNLFMGFFSAGTVMMGDTPKEILNLITGDKNNTAGDWE